MTHKQNFRFGVRFFLCTENLTRHQQKMTSDIEIKKTKGSRNFSHHHSYQQCLTHNFNIYIVLHWLHGLVSKRSLLPVAVWKISALFAPSTASFSELTSPSTCSPISATAVSPSKDTPTGSARWCVACGGPVVSSLSLSLSLALLIW